MLNLIINRTNTNTFLQMRSLSWKAKGLYAYLVSHSVEKWEIRHDDLYSRSTDARGSTDTGLDELKEAQLIYRLRFKKKDGAFAWGYVIYDKPTTLENVLVDLRTKYSNVSTDLERSDAISDTVLKVKVIIYIKEEGSSSLSVKPSVLPSDSKEPGGQTGPSEAAPPDGPSGPADNHIHLNRSRGEFFSARLCNNLSKKPKPKLKPLPPLKNIPGSIQEVMNLHAYIHKYRKDPDTGEYRNFKSYRTSVHAVKLLRQGTAFNNLPQYSKYHDRIFSYDEIKTVIERMRLALSLDYLPHDKTSLTSCAFADTIYNSWTKKSLFLQYLENAPKLNGNGNGFMLMPDPNPSITTRLENWYKTKKGLHDTELTGIEKNQLRQCTKLFIEFFNRNHRRMTHLREQGYIDLICEAIYQKIGEQSARLNTVLFCADWVWRDVIPSYFIDQCVMQG